MFSTSTSLRQNYHVCPVVSYKLSILYQKMLGIRSISGIFRFWNIYDIVQMGPNSKHYISYIPFTQNLKVILFNTFGVSACQLWPITYRVINAKKGLDFGAFWTSDFQIRDAQSSLASLPSKQRKLSFHICSPFSLPP